jgi:hypothetical protein
VGKTVSLYCQVGVVIMVQGILRKGGNLCDYSVELVGGNTIGFSFGTFIVTDNGTPSITVC